MKPVFGDTFYYLAILNVHDAHHAKAAALAEGLRRPVVTSEYVLLELLDAFAGIESRLRAAEWVRRLRRDPKVEIVDCTHELFQVGFELYGNRTDKTWSLTDCISFVVMRERKLTEALTHDHHFKQAGFRVLL